MEASQTSQKEALLKSGQKDPLFAHQPPLIEGPFPVYHGTDRKCADDIFQNGPGLKTRPFHDFNKGADTAFYLTADLELAKLFANLRAAVVKGQPAVCSFVFDPTKADIFCFDLVKPWAEFISHNRSRTSKGKTGPALSHDVLVGWISTRDETTHDFVPVQYEVNKQLQYSWQLVPVTERGLAALSERAIIPLEA